MAVPTGASRTTVANLFKKQYRDEKIHEQINLHAKLHQRMKKRAVTTTEGEEFVDFLLTQLSDAGRNFSEWGDLAQPRNVANLKAVYNMTFYNRSVRASGRAIKSGGAAVGPLIQEIQRMVDAMNLNFEKSLFQESTGKLATIAFASADDSVRTSKIFLVDNAQLLNIGMRVGVLVESSGAVANGVEEAAITAIDVDEVARTFQVTIDTDLGLESGVNTTYALFPSHEYNTSPFGLPDIVSESNPTGGNFGQLDRSTAANASWKSTVEDANHVTLTGGLIAHMDTIIGIKSGRQPTIRICHPYVFDDLIEAAKKDARIEMSKMNFELWGTSVTVGGIPIMAHRFCKYSDMWFLNENTIHMAYPDTMKADGEWIRDHMTGGGHLQQVPNKWAWQAVWVVGRQRTSSMPVANALLENIKWAPFGTA